MITAKVMLTQPLKTERQFAATTGSEHHMLLDDPAGGTGPKPIELVATALAGCTAFDVVTILRQKFHQKVKGYEVRNRPRRNRGSNSALRGKVLLGGRNGEANG